MLREYFQKKLLTQDYNMFNSKLYQKKYHSVDLSNYKFLITGGAGFIGSNLVEYLLLHNAGHVRILDNLSNGNIENIKDFLAFPNCEFIEGDIRDLETCKRAVAGIDFVSHQAALGSVPRSITDPNTSNDVNISGFLNMITASKDEQNVKQFVYAASSSSYGDSKDLPKIEGREGKPLSPYAVTKLVNELYADVFSNVYGFHTIGLRYFNVFGPNQSPNNPYAAVIPIFMKSALLKTRPRIFGDGETSRDFTFVQNVVQANILSLFKEFNLSEHMIFNIACGETTTLNQLWSYISDISTSTDLKPEYYPERMGDIKASLADISKANYYLKYSPDVNIIDGLRMSYEWFKDKFGLDINN